ncbi:unnamed protein product, partial [Polarella glacialis]
MDDPLESGTLPGSQVNLLQELADSLGGDGGDDAGCAKLALTSPSSEYEIFCQHWRAAEVSRMRRRASQASWQRGLLWLRQLQGSCRDAAEELNQLLAGLTELEQQHQEVGKKSATLRRLCEAGLSRQDQLGSFADGISQRLEVLGSAAEIARVLDRGDELLAAPAELASLLDRLEESAAYTESRYDFSEAKSCLNQFDHLRTRACIMLRANLQRGLERAESQVQELLWELSEESSVDTQIFYTAFQVAAPSFRPLMAILRQRMGSHVQYAATLEELEAFMASLRIRLVGDVVAAHLTSLLEDPHVAAQSQLAKVVRQTGSYMLDTASRELRCFEAFFEVRHPQDALKRLLEHLGGLFYETTKVAVLEAQSSSAVLEMVEVIRTDLLEPYQQQVATLEPALTAVLRLLCDAQQRLGVLARKELALGLEGGSSVVDPRDLDYPAALFQAVGSGLRPGRLPALDRSLSVLATTYHVLEASAFEALAREAVSCCVASLQRVARHLAQRSLQSHWASHLLRLLDAQLFLIRHLLVLREQIAAFEYDTLAAGGGSSSSSSRSSGASGPFLSAFSQISSSQLRRSQAMRNSFIESELESSCEAVVIELAALLCRPLALHRAKAPSGQGWREAAEAFLEAVRSGVPIVAAHFRAYLSDASGGAPNVLFQPLRERLLAAWAALLSENRFEGQSEVMGESEFGDLVDRLFEDTLSSSLAQIVETVTSLPRGDFPANGL